ncbi:MAG TPA: alpha/beta hydrolase [Acidimicrobiia bacterium]|nr:alpha/beta hydrolase [Acidimicrobiia bacterium]
MDIEVRSARLANGITLPYVQQGSPTGVPVVLIHAWGESKGSFDQLLPLLPPSLRTLAMDQRGHGWADRPAAGYGLSDFASDVKAFMDAVNIESAILMGSSSGGFVAQQVAAASPHRVAGLVLVGSPRTLQGRPSFADEVERLTDPIDPEWVRASLEWFPRFHPVPDWYIDDRVADGLAMPARVWELALEGLTRAIPPTDITTITAPTLIIWGARDELLHREDQKALQAAIPGSRLLVYEDTGHLVLWEQPERVAADLVDFIDRLGRATT